MDQQVVKKSEFAAMMNFSAAYVSKLLKTGRITATPAGLIDVAQARAQLAAARDPSKDGVRARHQNEKRQRHVTAHTQPDAPAAPADEDPKQKDSFFGVKVQRERALAQLAELDLAERTGVLVRADDVRKAEFGKARMVRDTLLSMPDRLAPLLAAESDPAKCHALIEAEVRYAITAMRADSAGEAVQ